MKIAILLATYNSSRFLEEQLRSIWRQSYKNWSLYVIDDGSSDNTLEILESYQKKWGKGKLTISSQTNRGCTYSFLSLVCDITIEADYYAYCDHDDVWEKEKLERAVTILSGMKPNIPLLYCSSTKLVNEHNTIIGHSTIFKRPPSFQNALVQNIASGNTMVFNKKARNLIAEIGVVDVYIHDWWTYLLVTACGGHIFYDPLSFIRYRQHGRNLIGHANPSTDSMQKKMDQQKKYFSNIRQFWTALHKAPYINSKAKKTLKAIENAFSCKFLYRAFWLFRAQVYLLTWSDTLGLYRYVLLRKKDKS